MLSDVEKKALLTQGTMNVADKGKVAAVTTLRQTVEQQTAKEMLTCVQACRHLLAYDRHGKEPRSRPVFASEGQDRIQVEESPERRAASASSMWRQQRRTRRTGAECTDRSESGMSSTFAGGGNCSAMPFAAATWQDKGLMSSRNGERRRKKGGETDGSDKLSAL